MDVPLSTITILNSKIKQDKKYKIIQSSLRKSSIKNVSTNQNSLNKLPFKFNHSLPESVSATNQYSSGRCWIFAGLNVLRHKLIQTHSLSSDFELSEAYMYKCDILEKCNCTLEVIYAFAQKHQTNQSIEYVSYVPNSIGDGGTVQSFVNLVNKYGVMPKDVFPDLRQVKNTSLMSKLINTTVAKSSEMINDKMSRNSFEEYKKTILEECHRILTICIGNTPENFVWSIKDSVAGKNYTPTSFYKKVIKPIININDYICISNDPRNKYNHLMNVEYLHNVLNHDDKDLKKKITNLYLNVEMTDFKKAVFETLTKYKTATWFATDFGTFVLNDSSILDQKSSILKDLFDVEFDYSKELSLKCRITVPNHAMCVIGCQKEGDDFLRWKIENSHGTHNNLDGFLTMSDAFFDKFMICAFVHKKSLSSKLRKIYKEKKDIISLPFWDVLGTYAH